VGPTPTRLPGTPIDEANGGSSQPVVAGKLTEAEKVQIRELWTGLSERLIERSTDQRPPSLG
jgi:hypothetical protein